MKTSKVTKPDDVSEQTWSDNQRWLKLMAAQSEQHRQSRDSRLYRDSAKQHLVKPRTVDKS